MSCRLPERGRLWWHARFYSICSAHFDIKPDCDLCQTGIWTNTWMHNLERVLNWINHDWWLWWVNRPSNPHRRFLEKTFPNLRNPDIKDDWDEEEILLTDEVKK